MEEAKKYIQNIQNNFPLERIKKILNSASNKKVLIVGDAIIDEYCFVEPKGRAMKDPILSVDYISQETYAGGTLAIANHVSNFVGEVTLLTLLGDRDDYKDFIISKLNKNIVPIFFTKKKSPTTKKKRYINNTRKEKLFKIEYINDQPISNELETKLISFLEKEVPSFDLILVGDFGHGFITEKIRKVLEEKSRFLSVNVQTNSANLGFNFVTKYNKPSFLTMDGGELRWAVGDRFNDYDYLVYKLHEIKGFNQFLVTLGKNGVSYFKDGKIIIGPSFVSKVKDVVGAGDAVFSVTSLLASENCEPELIPFIANCAGGIAVNIMGNERSVTKKDLLEFIEQLYKEADETGINEYFNAVSDTLNRLDKGSISAAVRLLFETYEKGSTIYAFGNGGSGATASHFCGDLIKGVSYGLEKRFKAICLNDNVPTLMAIANDISFDDIFIEQLKNFLRPEDLVVGISGSGNSINVIKALEYAKGKGAKTLAICGFKGGKIKEIADFTIHAEIDDMEISEDVHNLIIIHYVKRALMDALKNNNFGQEYVKRIS